jgi:hypothetical protein
MRSACNSTRQCSSNLLAMSCASLCSKAVRGVSRIQGLVNAERCRSGFLGPSSPLSLAAPRRTHVHPPTCVAAMVQQQPASSTTCLPRRGWMDDPWAHGLPQPGRDRAGAPVTWTALDDPMHPCTASSVAPASRGRCGHWLTCFCASAAAMPTPHATWSTAVAQRSPAACDMGTAAADAAPVPSHGTGGCSDLPLPAAVLYGALPCSCVALHIAVGQAAVATCARREMGCAAGDLAAAAAPVCSHAHVKRACVWRRLLASHPTRWMGPGATAQQGGASWPHSAMPAPAAPHAAAACGARHTLAGAPCDTSAGQGAPAARESPGAL